MPDKEQTYTVLTEDNVEELLLSIVYWMHEELGAEATKQKLVIASDYLYHLTGGAE